MLIPLIILIKTIGSDANTVFLKVRTKQKLIIVYLIAIKDIPAGQELLVDYGEAYWQDQRCEIAQISMDIFENLREFCGSKPSKKRKTTHSPKSLEEIRENHSDLLRYVRRTRIKEETLTTKLDNLYSKLISMQYKGEMAEQMMMIGKNITIKILQHIIYIVSHYIGQGRSWKIQLYS
jgi:hypothetical protein